VKTLKRFLKGNAGNVATMFAFSIIPIAGMIGLALDYSRGANAKEQLQTAADTAAISANREMNMPAAQKIELARKVFNEQIANLDWVRIDQSNIKISYDDAGTIDFEVIGEIDTSFMAVLGQSTLAVAVQSQSTYKIQDPVEIALVLDTTGSMESDMPALRSAAKDFAGQMLTPSNNGMVRMSVVPYVGAVNPGKNALLGQVDVSADGRFHGYLFENGAYVATAKGCNYKPVPQNGGGGGPPPPPDPFDPGEGGNENGSLITDVYRNFAYVAEELLGISKAQAAPSQTPDVTPPFATTPFTNNDPNLVAPFTVQVPNGFRMDTGCNLWGPEKVSHFDLFDRIPSTTWMGCVEARPEPFDVTDEEPNTSKPDTLFVPFFWPDEPDSAGDPNNNYMPDYPDNNLLEPLGFWPFGWADPQDRIQSIFKYNDTTYGGKVDIQEDDPAMMGPNKGCPSAIVALTSAQNTVENAIDKLKHKFGGGTIVSEGLMWGWRTLSPKAPFSEGKPYGQAQKFLVLMSDGQNEINKNDLGTKAIYSDYNAYGYLGRWETRLSDTKNIRTFPQLNTYLDERLATACANAKKEGIIVISLLFNTNEKRAEDGMRNCATSPQYFFKAESADDFDEAFGKVSEVISKLRISK
jgi:Flp pilus assembly protein TadG